MWPRMLGTHVRQGAPYVATHASLPEGPLHFREGWHYWLAGDLAGWLAATFSVPVLCRLRGFAVPPELVLLLCFSRQALTRH